jgi:hypothetical protein
LLLVSWDPANLAVTHLENRVDGLESVREGVLTRDGSVVRRYYYRIAHDYKNP